MTSMAENTAMKETQILFQAPMVLATIAGTKSQTRRVVKPLGAVTITPFIGADDKPTGEFGWCPNERVITTHIRCPYGQPGNRLWVRETFFAYGRWETRFSKKKGRDEWHFIDMTLECGHTYSYAADGGQPVPMRGKRDAGVTPGWWKRPAIFMPRAASRITLEITEVRIERLQDISEADAKAEGVSMPDGTPTPPDFWSYVQEYAHLWDRINGAGSWDANPHVWRISFKRVDQ